MTGDRVPFNEITAKSTGEVQKHLSRAMTKPT
jgi:hypothetical protein